MEGNLIITKLLQQQIIAVMASGVYPKLTFQDVQGVMMELARIPAQAATAAAGPVVEPQPEAAAPANPEPVKEPTKKRGRSKKANGVGNGTESAAR